MLSASTSSRPSDLPLLLGESAAIAALRIEIAAAARTAAKVLILGETGVGKEVVAQLVHAQSARRGRAFVAVNCSGIPETLLESELFGHKQGSFTGAFRDKMGLVRRADGGTLFLDELGEMSLRMQSVLLRFAETGEVQTVGADGPMGRTDARLITATNRDLRARVAEGAFREDLYYRLNVIQVRIPPLRDRADDILLLMRHYLERASVSHKLPLPAFTAAAERTLLAYAWPGNVRELKNITERLVLREAKQALTPDDLPTEIGGSTSQRLPHRSVVANRVAVEAVTLSDAPSLPPRVSDTVHHLWQQMAGGEDFWTVVHRRFAAREITRNDLAALVDRGLKETRGSYRAMLKVFNLPPSDYKRFHTFLYQQQCNLPVGPYRRRPAIVRSTACVPVAS